MVIMITVYLFIFKVSNWKKIQRITGHCFRHCKDVFLKETKTAAFCNNKSPLTYELRKVLYSSLTAWVLFKMNPAVPFRNELAVKRGGGSSMSFPTLSVGTLSSFVEL